MKNILSDAMTRLVLLDSDISQSPVPEGQDYGYFSLNSYPVFLKSTDNSYIEASSWCIRHNGTTRTYLLVRGLYNWKGLKTYINKCIMQCIMSEKKHTSSQVCSIIFSNTQVPMKFISMNLIGLFDPSSSDHQYNNNNNDNAVLI